MLEKTWKEDLFKGKAEFEPMRRNTFKVEGASTTHFPKREDRAESSKHALSGEGGYNV
jgi:hypothetical protein